jgi:hypothetical protein
MAGKTGGTRTRVLLAAVLAALALAAPAAGGTSLGTNLVGVTDFNGNLAFSNLMRQARPFCSQRLFGSFCQGEPLNLDAHGYPTSLPADTVARTIVVADSGLIPEGRYRARWAGTGAIEIPFGVAQLESQDANSAIFEITPMPGTPLELRITATDPGDHLRGLRLLLPGRQNGSRTEMFNPAYLDLLRPFRSLRFMDWGRTNSSRVADFSGRAHVGDVTYATDSGVPLEIMVDLANTLDADPWFNVPTRATNDYVRQMAALVDRCLEPGLVPRVEYSNETWNSAFDQFTYTEDQGERLGLAPGDRFVAGLRFTAHRTLTIWDIWAATLGDRPYRRVIASQSANTFTGETELTYRRRAGEPSAGQRADEYAIAPYFTVPGLDDPDRLTELRSLTVKELLDRAAADVDGRIQNELAANRALVDEFGINLAAYEGGQHLVGAAGNQDDGRLTDKLIAANRTSRIGLIYSRYLERWRRTAGGTFDHFTDVTIPSKFGSWGSVESLLQDPATAPKLQALKAFAARVNPPAPTHEPITPCR